MIKAVIFDFGGVICDYQVQVVDEAVISLLRRLRSNELKIGLMSNWSMSIYDALKQFGIRKLFDVVVTSEEAGAAKPHVSIYDKTCQLLAVNPSDCVFIDDTIGHVEGAERAGLIGLHFSGADQLQADLERLNVL